MLNKRDKEVFWLQLYPNRCSAQSTRLIWWGQHTSISQSLECSRFQIQIQEGLTIELWDELAQPLILAAIRTNWHLDLVGVTASQAIRPYFLAYWTRLGVHGPEWAIGACCGKGLLLSSFLIRRENLSTCTSFSILFLCSLETPQLVSSNGGLELASQLLWGVGVTLFQDHEDLIMVWAMRLHFTQGWAWWFMTVIPAMKEIGIIEVWGQPWQKVSMTPISTNKSGPVVHEGNASQVGRKGRNSVWAK
jgi:hypothetical protein